MEADAIILLALPHNPAAHLQRLVSRTNMLAQVYAKHVLLAGIKRLVTSHQKPQSAGRMVRVVEIRV